MLGGDSSVANGIASKMQVLPEKEKLAA
jgi:hypothetical protein